MYELIIFATGILVGVINSIAGGGMLLGFPMLVACGLPAISANATGYVAGLPGQIASAIGYRKRLKELPKVYLILFIPSIIGAMVGAYLLRSVDASSFKHVVPFMILLAVVVFALQPPLRRYFNWHGKLKSKRAMVVLSIVILLVSVYGGFFVPGFGFVLLALIGFMGFKKLSEINGLKNILEASVLFASIVVLYGSNLIDWRYGLIMGVGTMVGGYAGARKLRHIPVVIGRIIVVVLGLLAAGYLSIATR